MRFKILNIRLKKSSFQLNEEILAHKKEFIVTRKLTVGVRRGDVDKNLVVVEVAIKNENMDAPFNFDIVYQGFFKFEPEGDTSDEEIERRATVNCGAMIFAYLREHLADLTRRADLAPFHLPPVDFVKLYKQSKKS